MKSALSTKVAASKIIITKKERLVTSVLKQKILPEGRIFFSAKDYRNFLYP